ncbi:MAG: hypothetical protein QGH23_09640 [Dehalococcoidia bacterium]|nr:hypothetical protein [Dehalococcoidia bacterium]MDP6782026.1 hypothetical protein [Dehalococcoidia bacterium]
MPTPTSSTLPMPTRDHSRRRRERHNHPSTRVTRSYPRNLASHRRRARSVSAVLSAIT